MVAVVVVAALVVLALITQAGVFFLQRAYPAQGKLIEVSGATLHVIDIGPRDAAGPPIVMIHGASSNLEVMRRPLGDMLAGRHRVILIDRPGHGWSTRARFEDSTPAIQGRMIDEALGKLGVRGAIFVVHSWAGALGALMALDYPQRVAGLVMLAPVAYPWPGGVGRYNKIITTPVIGPLLAYTITLPLGYLLAERGARGVFLPQTMPDRFRRGFGNAIAAASAGIHRQCLRPGDAEGSGEGTGAALCRHQGARGGDFGRRFGQDGIDQNPFAAVHGRGAECQTDGASERRSHGAEHRARTA